MNIAVSAGGVVIGVIGNGSSASFTWSNLTENADALAEAVLNYSGASAAFAGGSTVSVSATPSTGNSFLTVASWR